MTSPPLPAAIRVLIVEDDDFTRESLCQSVAASQGYVLAAKFDRAQRAIAWLELHEPDILLTDLGLPDGSGLDIIKVCAARWPLCDMMVITMFGDEKNVFSAIEAGASGYILKDGGNLDVNRALQDLRNGGSPMSPLIARKVLAQARLHVDYSTPVKSPGKLPHNIKLTNKESETLNLIARGYTYEEITGLLSVSLSTVQTHIRSIYGKLAVNSRSEAVFEAHKMGLLQRGLLDQAE